MARRQVTNVFWGLPYGGATAQSQAMRRRGGRFLLGAALGTGIALSITSMHALPTRAFDPGTAEQQLFNLTNQDRTSNGLGALVPDDRLFAIARSAPNQVCGGAQTFSGRAADMIQRGYFSHQIPPCNQYVWPVLDAYGLHYYSAGENIAWNNSPTTTSASDANIAFMNSPEHR